MFRFPFSAIPAPARAHDECSENKIPHMPIHGNQIYLRARRMRVLALHHIPCFLDCSDAKARLGSTEGGTPAVDFPPVFNLPFFLPSSPPKLLSNRLLAAKQSTRGSATAENKKGRRPYRNLTPFPTRTCLLACGYHDLLRLPLVKALITTLIWGFYHLPRARGSSSSPVTLLKVLTRHQKTRLIFYEWRELNSSCESKKADSSSETSSIFGRSFMVLVQHL